MAVGDGKWQTGPTQELEEAGLETGQSDANFAIDDGTEGVCTTGVGPSAKGVADLARGGLADDAGLVTGLSQLVLRGGRSEVNEGAWDGCDGDGAGGGALGGVDAFDAVHLDARYAAVCQGEHLRSRWLASD
jgi:hypothetical protein